MFDREKQHLWTIFAAAGLTRGNPPKDAASLADSMLTEFEKRFPRDERDD